MTTSHPDTAYPDPDLVAGYITRRRVKTFHTADPANLESGLTACGRTLAELIPAGWARGLRRQGLNLCAQCAGTVTLDAAEEEE